MAALPAEWNGQSGLSGEQGTLRDKQLTGGWHQGGAEGYSLLNEEPLQVENLQSFHSSILSGHGIKITIERGVAVLQLTEEAAQTLQTSSTKSY